MIEPKDLRIGNWVMAGKSVVQVESLDERGINLYISYGVYGSTDYDGEFHDPSGYNFGQTINSIPLTPDILMKCNGSKMDDYDRISIRLTDGFIILNTGDKTILDCEDSHYNQFPDILDLHQLQNLYFALTGTELTYNP